jgi:hypothetical protein
MDNAVAVVQAYLRVNGYLTVAEYPVLEAARAGDFRTVTDLDILAFRFPGAGRLVPRAAARPSRDQLEVVLDPALGGSAEHADMIVGEVKESRAVLNEAALDPAVLRTAIVRFGCCAPERAQALVAELVRIGSATLPVGHQIRMVAFGATAGGAHVHQVTLGHCVDFLREYLREHWDVQRHAEHKDPVFGLLAMMEKARRASGRRT